MIRKKEITNNNIDNNELIENTIITDPTVIIENIDNNDNNAPNIEQSNSGDLELDGNYKIINISLPDNFNKILEDVFDDEFKIAQKKWGIKLTTKDKNLIKHHTYGQLIQKVTDTTYNKWDVEDNLITVRIVAENDDDLISHVSISENTFTPQSMADKLIVFNVTQGYTIVTVPTRKTVNLTDFYEHIVEVILNWVRTGAFYGVASFHS